MMLGLAKKRVFPEPLPPMTRIFLFLAFFGSFGRLDIISRSVCVSSTLFSNTGSIKGLISAGVPHEAFCQVLF